MYFYWNDARGGATPRQTDASGTESGALPTPEGSEETATIGEILQGWTDT